MNARRRGLAVGGWAVLTILALFAFQEWHRHWVALKYAHLVPPDGTLVQTTLEAQRAALSSGALPIDRAIERVARTDRMQLRAILPVPSTDPAPAAGWRHHPLYVEPPRDTPSEAQAPTTPTQQTDGATAPGASAALSPQAPAGVTP
ncbi:MAG: hypothetical protein RMK74_10650 [Myxococcales bacterium]|nr:hypothetical protein [Myxococcales bacterium]